MKKLLLVFSLFLIAAVTGNAQNPRNVLIYNITSTDCGPCSCMDSLFLHKIKPAFPQTIVVSLHGPGSHFHFYQGNEVIREFHALYEPSGFIDGLGYDTPHMFIYDSLSHRYTQSPEAPVRILTDSWTWDDNYSLLSFNINLTNVGDNLPGNYWYNILVTEDNLRQSHRTYTGCSTPSFPTPPLDTNYINHDVIRKLEFYAKGDSLIGPMWEAQRTVSRKCSIFIDPGWIAENCNITVTVYKNADSLFRANVQQAYRRPLSHEVGMQPQLPSADRVVKIFPNPSGGHTNIHIALSSTGNCRLTVLDMQGKEIETLLSGLMHPGSYNVEMNTAGYIPGSYIVRLATANGEFHERLVVL